MYCVCLKKLKILLQQLEGRSTRSSSDHTHTYAHTHRQEYNTRYLDKFIDTTKIWEIYQTCLELLCSLWKKIWAQNVNLQGGYFWNMSSYSEKKKYLRLHSYFSYASITSPWQWRNSSVSQSSPFPDHIALSPFLHQYGWSSASQVRQSTDLTQKKTTCFCCSLLFWTQWEEETYFKCILHFWIYSWCTQTSNTRQM